MITNPLSRQNGCFQKLLECPLTQSYKDQIHERSNENASYFRKWLAAEQ